MKIIVRGKNKKKLLKVQKRLKKALIRKKEYKPGILRVLYEFLFNKHKDSIISFYGYENTIGFFKCDICEYTGNVEKSKYCGGCGAKILNPQRRKFKDPETVRKNVEEKLKKLGLLKTK